MNRFPGKLALQQRVLPMYRAPFFDLLASACDGGMSLFTGMPRVDEGVIMAKTLQVARYTLGKNIHLFNGGSYLCYQRGLKNWLEAEKPDALIVEANLRYLSTPSAVQWMHERKKPVIGWGLGAPQGKWIGKKIWASFVNQFDAMIAYSQRGAGEYAALGFPREKVFIAYNSVSPVPTHPLPSRRSTFSARPNILFVGRLQARKRIDLLLRACAQMDSSPRLVIVGDGPERAALEAFAQEVHPGAEFIGARHGAELTPYFTGADLFVLPGTGGLAVHEAMSHGLPVIVAQGDGTQDDLVRKGNGWQIPPDDFDALVSTMKEALSDVTRLRKMGEESYRIVVQEINLERMVKTFVTALNTVSGKSAGTP